MKYDFCGYVTRNNIRCADGRIIRQNAFKDNDGDTVPLVWHHMHDEPENVLGHAVLENREDGVYGYGVFNDTERGQVAKDLVKHGDIKAMSIYANKLSHSGDSVTHGVIREVSLVMAGANPGAFIENVTISHADGTYNEIEDEAVIYSGSDLELIHSAYTAQAKPDLIHADEPKSDNQNGSNDDKNSDDETVQDVLNTLTDKQMKVVEFLIGAAVEEANENDDSDDSEEGNDDMKHNIFDVDEAENEDVLSHDAMMEIIEDGKRMGSMKESFIQHGIEDIDILYPEAKTITPEPAIISRRMDWVSKVWNGVKKTPFSRIKSIVADITEDEARARGYIKGNEKLEEKFGLLKRVTTPQTIYKKQALDRDDVIDITDFDVVAWLKQEMRMMLDEELARAILVGDGRMITSQDKIKEDNIRPIATDDDLYTIKYEIQVDTGETDANKVAEEIVDSAIRSRRDYQGSGTPTFYASPDIINTMMLSRDKVGHRMYKTEAELASALRVNEIVEVPVLDQARIDPDGTGTGSNVKNILGVIVNLSDYSIGTDRGGEVNFFDDFDIDFNKEKYLLETRCSGALTLPKSAIVLTAPQSFVMPYSTNASSVNVEDANLG